MLWHKSGAETENATIARVGALDGDCFEVVLSNGHTIFLELGSRIREPVFASLIERGVFDKPRTDGTRLYWPDGPAITLAEIFAMLTSRSPYAAADESTKI
jgi:hypothetical protein